MEYIYTYSVWEEEGGMGVDQLFTMDIVVKDNGMEAEEIAMERAKEAVEEVYPFLDGEDIMVQCEDIHVDAT